MNSSPDPPMFPFHPTTYWSLRRALAISAISAMAALLAGVPPIASAADRVALVIGNNAYTLSLIHI